MSGQNRTQELPLRLDPEKVAYWYFRLNGFLTIENFVVHDHRGRGHMGHGSQRTEADLLGARFPHRAECMVETPEAPMPDDTGGLGIAPGLIEVVIVEMTASERCKLNGPWTNRASENMQRVLAAIGCVPTENLENAASDLYDYGSWTLEGSVRVRLIAVGHSQDPNLKERFPYVVQITWEELVRFIYDRLNRYRSAKSHSPQWDNCGTKLRKLADREPSRENYVRTVLEAMCKRAVP